MHQRQCKAMYFYVALSLCERVLNICGTSKSILRSWPACGAEYYSQYLLVDDFSIAVVRC